MGRPFFFAAQKYPVINQREAFLTLPKKEPLSSDIPDTEPKEWGNLLYRRIVWDERLGL